MHNWFKCIVYTQPTNEFKPQPGPNFLFAQVGYRNRVLTSHILQILGRPSNIRGCEKPPTLHTLTSLLHQGILLEIPAALSLNPYLFRANKNVRKENRCLFFWCDQVSFLCTSGTCVAGDKKDTQDLNKKQQHKTHEITMAAGFAIVT